MLESHQKAIILFDGVCNLCNSSVRFIIKRDRGQKFLFSSLQSDAAKKLLLHNNYKNKHLESMILIENDQIFDKSDAVLRICALLGFPWSLFSASKIFPPSWRNGFYEYIAKHRYRWFGKKDQCIYQIDKHEDRFV